MMLVLSVWLFVNNLTNNKAFLFNFVNISVTEHELADMKHVTQLGPKVKKCKIALTYKKCGRAHCNYVLKGEKSFKNSLKLFFINLQVKKRKKENSDQSPAGRK